MPSIGQIYGGNFTTPIGNVLNNGTITFELSQECQVIGMDTQIVPEVVSYKLNSVGSVSNFPATVPLWLNSQLNPGGNYYIVKIYTGGGQLVAGPMNWLIQGTSPIDLGTIVSTGTPMSFVTLSIADNIYLYNASGNVITLTGSNQFAICTSGVSGITLTLPSAALNTGLSVKFLKVDSGVGAVNIAGGIAGYSLFNQYQYVIFESNGTTWYVNGNN